MKSWKGLAGALTELTGRGIIAWHERKKEKVMSENHYEPQRPDGLPIEQQASSASGAFQSFTPADSAFMGDEAERLRALARMPEWPANYAPEEVLPRRGAHEQHPAPYMPMEVTQAPQGSPGLVDITSLLKAQARFIETQTRFLEEPPGTSNFTGNLMSYSRAQNDMIRAQAEVLRQLGVI